MTLRKHSAAGLAQFTLSAAAIAFAPSSDPAAQVPDGHYVVSCVDASGAGAAPGPGGLFVLDPRIPGPSVAVQGLPPELTGVAGAPASGANCVSICADGTLLVGELTGPNDTVDLHFLSLQGNTVVQSRKVSLGRAMSNHPWGASGINSAIELPDGNILVTLAGLVAQAPLFGNQLAIVTPSGQVRPLGNVQGDYANAAVLHEARQSVFVSVYPDAATRVGTLVEIDYPNATSQRVVTRLDDNAALAVDAQGRIVASRRVGGQGQIVRLDPSTGAVQASWRGWANGLAIERATDVAAIANGGAKGGYVDPTQGRTWLSRDLTGEATGIDVAQNPRVYGAPSGAATFTWRTAPNPGGLPRLGNVDFGLQLDGPSLPGALFVSLGAADLPLQSGVRMLVEPAAGFALPVPVVPGTPVSLPIPGSIPVGVPLHFQSFHVAGGSQLAASAGLRVTPLR